MAACLRFGIRLPPPGGAPPKPDLFGLLSFGGGLALVYAALDQGNRLDWLHSGLIWGLLLGGVVLEGAFYLHLRRIPNYWLNLPTAFAYPLPIIFVLVALLRLGVLSTAFLVPQFLEGVRGFRTFAVGDALLWVAVPQLLLCPLSGYLLRYPCEAQLLARHVFDMAGQASIVVKSRASARDPRRTRPHFRPRTTRMAQSPEQVPQPAARHGFIQTFGLDIRAAGLALIVDNMVFAGTIASVGALYAVEIVAGCILGFITYKIQRHWYGDGHDSALIKGLAVGLLTAIPVPLTTTLTVGPAGLLGLLHLFLPRR
jgi:hypothetical protein